MALPRSIRGLHPIYEIARPVCPKHLRYGILHKRLTGRGCLISGEAAAEMTPA